MKGSMRKRGDSWELRVYLGLHPASGRRRYATRTVHGGKRVAERALASFVVEVTAGEQVATSATVDDLLDRWWSVASQDWSAATRRQNESAIRTHIRPALGSTRLSRLTGADLDRWYADLRRKPGRSGASMAPSTIVRIAGILRSALSQAVRWGWIPANPSQTSTLPKVRRPQLTPPDVEAMNRMLAAVRNKEPDLYAFLKVAASTGARRSQICGLQWGDLDLKGRRVTFARGVVDGDAGIEVKGTKTDRTYRVALDRSTVETLIDHRRRTEQVANDCGTKVRPSSFVFSNEADGSKPWRPDGVTHRWIRWRKLVGLDEVRLHDVRHFMATTMLSAGVPVSVVAGRLGHARSATTLNVYSHFVDAGDEEAAEALERLMEVRSEGSGQPNDGQMMGKDCSDVQRPHHGDGA
jgi:integrase